MSIRYTAVYRLPGIVALGTVLALHADPLNKAAAIDGLQLAIRVQQADAERGLHAGEVVSSRRYVLRNSRWADPAVMHARMIFMPGREKRFEVVSMEHTGALQKHVFMQVLAGEVSVSATKPKAKPSETDGSLSTTNYDFAYMGSEMIAGRQCAVLQLLPKRKSKYLIAGRAWVDIEAAAVLRIEGHTAGSVSFWIGTPSVTQQFRKVNDLWLPSSMRSASDVRFLGNTELTIEYLAYTVNHSDESLAAAHPSPPDNRK